MDLPPTNGNRIPGARAAPGSSIIDLVSANPDDRPTILTGQRAAAGTLILGQKLGHFELLDTIGRGGMATVLRARDLELNRIVALKILPPELARDADSVTRFKNEARSAASLDHDHIARAYFCGEERGVHFIAFEFIAGENLRDRILRQGPLGPAEALRFLLQLANGLKHAAERGVVHRDIKPSNIIITPEGLAKIVDMGLARSQEASVNGGVTHSGVTLGTFDYISPEQALDPRRADLRSDIYSLGCTFYHAVTGRPPCPEGTAAQKLQAQQHAAPIDPRDLNPNVPDALAEVLARMMAKDPARRPATADELIGELQRVAIDCGIPIDGPMIDVAIPMSARPASRFQLPLTWLILGTAAAIALAVLINHGPTSKVPTFPPWGEVSQPERVTEEAAAASNPGTVIRVVANLPQLLEALKLSDRVIVKLQPGAVFDLAVLETEVVYSGPGLELEADGPADAAPPVLRVRACAEADHPAALSFRRCGPVALRGIDIQVAASSEREAAASGRAALRFYDVNQLTVSGCRMRMESTDSCIGVAVASNALCEIIVNQSIFDLGVSGTAWQLPSGCKVSFSESAFAPHRSAIEWPAEETMPAGCDINLSSCTFMVDQGCAVRIGTGGHWKIIPKNCMFAAVKAAKSDDAMPGGFRPGNGVALQLEGEAEADSRWLGIAKEPNGYFQVTPLAVAEKSYTFIDLPEALFVEPAPRLLTRLPWAVPDPRLLLGAADPAAAFRLSLNDPRLRLSAASTVYILGAKRLGPSEATIYPGPWPPDRPLTVKAGPAERVVWPDADAEDGAARLYPTFSAAFAALQPGETLTLALSGPVPVPLLADATVKATIRAAAGARPVLVAEGPGFTTDSALFRLAGGELTFEGLEIRLKDRQAIAIVSGGASCNFRGCVLTLAGSEGLPVAAVVIPDPSREMKSTDAVEEPRVLFQNSIVRGEGRAINVLAARAFLATFENCAIALDGNLISLDAPERAAGATPTGKLLLKRSTIVLDDPAIVIHAARTPSFLSVTAEHCLFTAADPKAAGPGLLLIDDADAVPGPTKFFSWSGRGSVLAFADSSQAMEWRTGGDAANSWDWVQWQTFTRDDSKHVPRLRFARGSLKPKLASIGAADFALSASTSVDAGADLGKLGGESR